MQKISIRNFGASAAALTILLGVGAVFPSNSAAQTPSPTPQTQKKESTDSKTDSKKAKKEKAAKADKKPNQDKSAAPVNGKSPLSVNENPDMIGKRKINGGSDKLFGWLGGSQEKEVAIGRQLSLEVEQQSKLVDDPVVTEYVNRVGQNIVLHSDAKLPFTIKVIDSDEVNAFALPGGFFYVNKGLILAADNESELAGVMAHEIAHVTARHAMENQGKGTLINYGALAGIIFGGPIVSTVLQNGGGILAGLASLKFSRAAETEADKLGVQYLYASGYDPTGMATMFEKLASKNKKKPGSLAKLFSTHPQSLDRRDTSLQLIARFNERDEYVISTSEFQRVKAHLLRLSNAKAGVTADYDEGDAGRPTLKKRQPDADSSDSTGTSSSSDGGNDAPPKLQKRTDPTPAPTTTQDGPPQLKKRGEPEVKPTPDGQ